MIKYTLGVGIDYTIEVKGKPSTYRSLIPQMTITAPAVTPWIFPAWNDADLAYVAGALQTMNPLGFKDAQSRASYIRNQAEIELNRHLDLGKTEPFHISSGGWTICFVKYAEIWQAIPAISPYTAARFIADLQIPNQDCHWKVTPTGTGGTYRSLRVEGISFD